MNKNFMVNLWFAATIAYAINSICKHSFKCQAEITCQTILYYLIKSLIILVILILFMVLVKCYKLRVRDNEAYIHLIVKEHYEKYLNQDIQYMIEIELSLESTD